jgi:hypothetical protein
MRRRFLFSAVLLAAVSLGCATASQPPAQSQPAAQPPAAAGPRAVAAPDTAAPVVPADSASMMAFGHSLNDWFWTIEADSLWAHTGDETRSFMQSASNLADQIFGFVSQFGVETAMVSEALARQGDNYVYTRVVRTDGSEKPWTVAWTYRPDRTIVNVSLQPGE